MEDDPKIKELKEGLSAALNAMQEQESNIVQLEQRIVSLESKIKEKDQEIETLKNPIAVPSTNTNTNTTSTSTTSAAHLVDQQTSPIAGLASSIMIPKEELTSIKGSEDNAVQTSPIPFTNPVVPSETVVTMSTENANQNQVLNELAELKLKNGALEQEIVELKKKLSFPKELQPSGTKLSHATRARPSHRIKVSKEEESSDQNGESDQKKDDNNQAIDKEGGSTNKNESQSPKDKSSNVSEQISSPKSSEPIDPTEQLKRKIAGMGGVNPLGGFNLLAAINPNSVQLKPRSKSESTEDLGTVPAVQVDKEKLFEWVKTMISSSEKEDQEDLNFDDPKSLFKNGQILCRLVNKVKGSEMIKINTGKFKFMQMENIRKYLEASESLGVSSAYRFAVEDVLEASNLEKVFVHLTLLMKLSSTSCDSVS